MVPVFLSIEGYSSRHRGTYRGGVVGYYQGRQRGVVMIWWLRYQIKYCPHSWLRVVTYFSVQPG